MSGTAYWEERERAKADALKMAAQLSAREKGTVVLGVNRGMCDDARHDQTQQRTFERSFLSLDAPDEDGNMWDYGDCGRAMRRMFRDLDAPFWERVRDLRFAAALDALEAYPELARALRAIRRHRHCGRKRIAAVLGISVATYAKRFTRICQVLAPLLA